MSRKRSFPYAIMENELTAAHIECCECSYIQPGCYCIPQVVQVIEPVSYVYDEIDMEPYFPTYTNATYVAEPSGHIYYMSDIEYPIATPAFMLPQLQSNRFEISEMPHIDEDDYYDPPESPRKRERFEDEEDDGGDKSSVTSKPNVYRSKEGYLVEEPADSNETKQQKDKDSQNNNADTTT